MSAVAGALLSSMKRVKEERAQNRWQGAQACARAGTETGGANRRANMRANRRANGHGNGRARTGVRTGARAQVCERACKQAREWERERACKQARENERENGMPLRRSSRGVRLIGLLVNSGRVRVARDKGGRARSHVDPDSRFPDPRSRRVLCVPVITTSIPVTAPRKSTTKRTLGFHGATLAPWIVVPSASDAMVL